MTSVQGLHHVTAIAGAPQRNLDFYTGVLGLRLVKWTVNFDDPRTYHFYFGDERGRPGTIVTFFAWPEGTGGRQGTGQAAALSLSIPADAVGYWIERLVARGVRYERPTRRFDEQVIAFRDPDGLMLELAAHERAAPADDGEMIATVPRQFAIRGLHTVTLWEEHPDATAELLTGTLGLRAVAEGENLRRFEAGEGGPGRYVDVRSVAGFWPGTEGVGVVHHVAWRVADMGALEAMHAIVAERGLRATPPLDRYYFHSVYFREPGGVLFELATDGPGFAVDEPPGQLGERLRLPPWLEGRRAELEAELPPVRPPHENVPVGEHSSLFRAQETAHAGKAGDHDETMSTNALDFEHRFVPASSGGPDFGLLLLHGTGGNEDDLIPLGRMLAPGSAMLSPRGKVLEHGAPRFFRRLAEGVFDLEDLERRTHELAAFVTEAQRVYALPERGLIAVGFSNGANIAGSLLLRHPGLLRGAVLIRAMVPFQPEPPASGLDGTRVLILSGRQDPLVPVMQAEQLARLLRDAGADVTLDWSPGGHQLTQYDVTAAGMWLGQM